MRPENKEYHHDWMLWSILNVAAKTKNGHFKEYMGLLPYIPYFSGVLDAIMREGEPGIRFMRLLAKFTGDIVSAKDKGKKTAVTTFCFSPAIFYAMDVVPITLEPLSVITTLMWKRGTADYLDFCTESGMTETSCTAQRGAIGAYLAGLGQDIDFVVCDTPGICDTNANSFSFLAAYLDKPFFHLSYPATLGDKRSNQYHRDDFMALIKFLESQTGTKLDYERLRDILKEMEKQNSLMVELEELQRCHPNPIPSIYNLFVYGGMFMAGGTRVFTELLESTVEEAIKKAKSGVSGLRSGREKVRALFCYIDHFTTNLRFWDWMDAQGVSQVGCLLKAFFIKESPYIKGTPNEAACFSIDTSTVDAIVDSAAQMNSRMPMVNCIRGPYDGPFMWLEGTLSVARMYDIDAIVYCGTQGCRNTWGMIKPFAKETEKYGFPTHIMYCDAFDDRMESWESTTARFKEFLEVRGFI